MDDYFGDLSLRQGFIARADVLGAGFDDRYIRRRLRARSWTKVRPGAYAPTTQWESLDAVARHDRLARAVFRAHSGAVALSHVSGLVVRRACDLWDVDLTCAHVTRRDGRSGSQDRDVVHHQGVLLDEEVEDVDGLLVVREARCLAETIARSRLEAGLCALDSALHRGRVTTTELEACRATMQRHPGSRTLDMALRLADGRSESVGETRSRYLFWRQGLPHPEPQFPVHDSRGDLVGIVDLALPSRGVLFEFDGRVKYGRLLRPGEEPGDVVFREKLREDALREATGFTVVRATWADLASPAVTADRVRRAMAVASAR